MKYFQHQIDASDDIKIKRLEEKFGNNGYAVFFKILEKIGKEGSTCCLSFKKYPKDLLAKEFHITLEVFEEILIRLAEVSLIDKKSLKKEEIYIPNMKKYADEYTARGKKYYEKKQIERFPKENYLKVEKEYTKLKRVQLQGSEHLPILKEIKIMFMSGRNTEEIIKCMQWMSKDDFYKDKWVISTVRKKLPEFLGGSLEEEIIKPHYAKS